MNNQLDQAILLRTEGKLLESNTLLLKMIDVHPNEAFLNYQCAWSFDVLGEESKAVPYYEKALALGLLDEELQGALLGLGSTYRTLGDYEQSKRVLLHGMNLFPNNRAIQVFLSMTLYNLKEHQDAMELLLTCLTNTTTDKEILNYQKAIHFYADKLDEIWQ
ncbi:tetratricopeptide repeat protein [Bacillus sp. FJAT-22090]|uniref:tetratricopeptide repeat protein n=1 Tax=Bacillus sp. FJAT-22090 TaxID=1581038 RepID=UPI0011AAAB79|nr:tetratricopeptide repeat protein [Bacillus sp. FJAT-22090]